MRRWTIRFLSKAHLAAYRLSRGRVLGSVAGMPVLLLTTTGRRSGKARATPLTFFRDATDLVVIASNGGADRPPDWSLNLQQAPRAVVEIGTDKVAVTARRASEHERERLWIVITATYAGYARYQERTTRRIPVVLLTPESAQAAHRPQPPSVSARISRDAPVTFDEMAISTARSEWLPAVYVSASARAHAQQDAHVSLGGAMS